MERAETSARQSPPAAMATTSARAVERPGGPANDQPRWWSALSRQLPHALAAMRPRQWTKNGLVVVAAVFAHRATDVHSIARVVLAFAAFCLVASAIYIVNDLFDRPKDRLHPRKRSRPIASGRLSGRAAACTAVVCLAGATLLVALLLLQPGQLLRLRWADPFAMWGGGSWLFALTLVAYFGINVAYSAWMKHQVLWDVFVIAAGFVLRALAGAFVVAVIISPWFYLAALFLSLFLALGKRRAELVAVTTDRMEGTRPSLTHYTQQLLDQLLTVVVACTLMTYSLYTFATPDAGGAMMVTVPFVVFGVFRYLYLIYVKGEGESPEVLLLRDRQILGAVVLCALVAVLVLYGVPMFPALHPAH